MVSTYIYIYIHLHIYIYSLCVRGLSRIGLSQKGPIGVFRDLLGKMMDMLYWVDEKRMRAVEGPNQAVERPNRAVDSPPKKYT